MEKEAVKRDKSKVPLLSLYAANIRQPGTSSGYKLLDYKT